MAVKSSRSAAPILPHKHLAEMQRRAEGQRRNPCACAPHRDGPCRRGRDDRAFSAASQLAGVRLTGKIASTPSPMNF